MPAEDTRLVLEVSTPQNCRLRRPDNPYRLAQPLLLLLSSTARLQRLTLSLHGSGHRKLGTACSLHPSGIFAGLQSSVMTISGLCESPDTLLRSATLSLPRHLQAGPATAAAFHSSLPGQSSARPSRRHSLPRLAANEAMRGYGISELNVRKRHLCQRVLKSQLGVES